MQDMAGAAGMSSARATGAALRLNRRKGLSSGTATSPRSIAAQSLRLMSIEKSRETLVDVLFVEEWVVLQLLERRTSLLRSVHNLQMV